MADKPRVKNSDGVMTKGSKQYRWRVFRIITERGWVDTK
jgi:hypothetical protein